MLKKLRKSKKHSRFFVFLCTFLFVIFIAFPYVNAKEAPKPKLQDWQINGIIAALNDGYMEVQQQGFLKIREYELKDLDKQKVENIANKAVKVIHDKNINAGVRSSAAEALGNLGNAAKPYVKNIVDILKDKNADPYIRSSSASALGNLGDIAKPYVKDIADILKDKNVDPYIRSSAAEALGKLDDAAKPYVKDIADILKDKNVDPYIRFLVAEALGNLGDAAKPYVKDIADMLKDKNVDVGVRASAVEILGNLGDAAKPYAKDILDILKDKNIEPYTRSNAASALWNLSDATKSYVKDILDFLKDKNVNANVRLNTNVFHNSGDAAKPHVKDILDFLKDKNVDAGIRSNTANALANLGDAAKPYLKDILDLLKDKNVDGNIRSNAMYALGNLGDAAKPYLKDIVDILKDKNVDGNIRSNAVYALGNLGDVAKPYLKDIVDILKDKNVDLNTRSSVATALGNIEPLQLNNLALVLDNIYYAGQSEFTQWRFLSYFLSGASDDTKTLLKWIGLPEPKSIPAQLNHDEAIKTLKVFTKTWNASKGLDRLREDLARQSAIVAAYKNVTWQPQDIVVLQPLCDKLKAVNSTHADALQSVINNLAFWKWIFTARNTILIHLSFWLLLIFAYPKYPQIQAIFFWNPWVRRILGMGYVGFLLTWVPFFRHKLLEPFKPSLLADAALDSFKPDGYFPQSSVKLPSGDILSVTQAVPNIHGQIILEGDSGLGKSMFLRQLAINSQRIVVYLPAYKCEKGVTEAVQAKLHGQAQDADFLRSLIYSGAIDICIDGINEVSAETRAKISEFVEKHFRGNVIMTTQPLEWIPPSTAKTYQLQPLTREQIESFLLSRTCCLAKQAKIIGADYEKACKNYLAKTLNDKLTPETLDAALQILSNPMDLTLVSEMISQAQYPDLFHLQQQQYNLMAMEYKQEWNHDFPLKKFSLRVYQLRYKDEIALPANEFNQEIMSMEDEKYKMIVSRQWQDVKYGKARKEWNFRHDKIMEFFLVQNFLDGSQEAEERQIKHIADSRFRGVYFALATLLPLDKASELRERLIQYAAKTKDYTVMGTYVQILQSRIIQS